MALKDLEDLNEIHLDALQEIGNIGSGHAASALSTVLDRRVNMSVPCVKILDYESVVEQLGGPEEQLVSILLSLGDDVSGMIMFLFHKQFANMILTTLLGEESGDINSLDEMSTSAIEEVGNIMAASYVNAIAELTGLRIDISTPSLSIDMAGSILSVPTIYYSNISDKIIAIEEELGQDDLHAFSYILMLAEVDSLEKIMKSLGLEA